MLFPQNLFGFSSRSIKTNYLSELAALQTNKNRSYTQVKSASGENYYQEANFGSLQLIREQLSGATHIQAAPPKKFLPLAAPLSNTNSFRFCGRERVESTLLQATGSEWDICSDSQLDYVGLILEYDSLNLQHQNLYQKELPSICLTSKATQIPLGVLNNYSSNILYIFWLISKTDNLFSQPKTCKFIANAVSQMALTTLSFSLCDTEKISPHTRRIQGVYRVIDYLKSNAVELPSISELCVIANLSERSLEYGFQELLGITPIKYLKVIRLNGVREALLVGHNSQIKISSIALQWGFLELGRFAAEYRQLFDELPSTTLNLR
jgi:AraC family ethanolamine operon transcriptional activator